MSAAVQYQRDYDLADVPLIVRSSIVLGLLQSVLVFAFSVVSRFLQGPAEWALEGVLLLAGFTATCALPGLWTKARSGNGIAAAAGIGLGATVAFLAVDVTILQRVGTYTNRWLEIGGGSNWWYHPVWWMAGTYLAWMGAMVIANQTAKDGAPSVPGMMATSVISTIVLGAAAVVISFPGAGWNVATFGVAFLGGITVAAMLSAMGRRTT